MVLQVITSARANAIHNFGMDKDRLIVCEFLALDLCYNLIPVSYIWNWPRTLPQILYFTVLYRNGPVEMGTFSCFLVEPASFCRGEFDFSNCGPSCKVSNFFIMSVQPKLS